MRLHASGQITAYADWYLSGFLSRDSRPARAALHVREVPAAECEAIAAARPEPPLQGARLGSAGGAACVRDVAGSDVHLFIPGAVPGFSRTRVDELHAQDAAARSSHAPTKGEPLSR